MTPHQRGASGILIAVLLVIVAGAALAVLSLSGLRGGVERGGEMASRFVAIQDALVQFVAANGRLPCPAQPDSSDGTASPDAPAAACAYPRGTVPWKSLSLRPEHVIDPWGGKISYRVYTAATGSLTQDKGASMEDCDLDEPTPGGVDGNGICRTARDTETGQFLIGKGRTVNDSRFPIPVSGVAYVLISHGPSGLGAYTTGNLQKPIPTSGDELANLSESGPFIAKAISPKDVASDAATHFDDLLVYAKIEDLINRAGRGARRWPETPPPAPPPALSGQVSFDQSTVEAAVGGSVTPGSSVGSVTVTFVGVVVTGSGSGSSDVSFDVVGGVGGIGVAGGGSALVQSSANESLSFAISDPATKFGVTLNDFGIYSGTFVERVQFRFFLGATEVATRVGAGCRADGGLASFEGDIGTNFDRVEVTPLPALDTGTFTFTGITALLVSQGRACPATEPTCATSLADAGNICPL